MSSPEVLIARAPQASFLLALFNFNFSDVGTTQCAMKNCGLIDVSDGSVNWKERNTLQPVLRSKCSLHLAAFNIWTLNQIGQQAALTRTLVLSPKRACSIPLPCSFFVAQIQPHWFHSSLVRCSDSEHSWSGWCWDGCEHASKACTVRLNPDPLLSMCSFAERFCIYQ